MRRKAFGSFAAPTTDGHLPKVAARRVNGGAIDPEEP
jgi:hypothetical protein